MDPDMVLCSSLGWDDFLALGGRDSHSVHLLLKQHCTAFSLAKQGCYGLQCLLFWPLHSHEACCGNRATAWVQLGPAPLILEEKEAFCKEPLARLPTAPQSAFLSLALPRDIGRPCSEMR